MLLNNKNIELFINCQGLKEEMFLKTINLLFPSHQVVASDRYCQQYGQHGRSKRWRVAKGLVVDVGDDVQRSAVGLFAGGLDLILRELKAKGPVVSQLKCVSEGDPFETSPVSGWTGVRVYRNKEQGFVTIHRADFGGSHCKQLTLQNSLALWSDTQAYTTHPVKFRQCTSSHGPFW